MEADAGRDAGRYNPHKTFGARLNNMTIGTRSPERDLSNTPPPGAYNTDNAIQFYQSKSTCAIISKERTVSPLKRNRDEVKSPAPGHYDIANTIGSSHTPRIGFTRAQHKWKPLNENPGPGQHDASIHLTRPRTPGLEMGKTTSRRNEFLVNASTDTPAPTYDIKGTFGDKKGGKVIMGNKLKYQPKNNNPGPGQYDGNIDKIRKRPTSAINMNKTCNTDRHAYL
jgi:hypothetical protein